MKIAVGNVTIQWAVIDHLVTQMLWHLWFYEHSQAERPPRSFDRRIAELKRLTKILYQNEPDEFRTYSWFDQRIRSANGRRDDITHGIPGVMSKNGKEYEVLHIQFPSQIMPKYSHSSVESVEQLAEELKALYLEAVNVFYAISTALVASSQNTVTGPAPYGLKPAIPGNRSPRLPRENLPPPTFQA
ncbi:MAG: hypothetical protein ACOY3N_31530 [Bradyrhizobium sp.]|uniref:hypothetical protein n=1 Tax=Bradyrhizobium sp. TaxID=376 RepID=UPI003BF1F399